MVKPFRLSNLIILTFLFLSQLFFILVFTSCSTSKIVKQRTDDLIEKAQQAILDGDYSEAERLVLKGIRNDSTHVKAYLLLSDISDELSKPEQQIAALERVVKLDSVGYPLAFKLLAALYFSDGEYSSALKQYQQYQLFKKASDSVFISSRVLSCIFAQASIMKERKVPIISPGQTINTPLQEYWPAIATNDSLLYFTRLLINENNFPFERIFQSVRSNTGWEEAEQLMVAGDENINIGTMCISADGKILFYTACGQQDGYGSCDIYYSRRKDGNWSKPVNAGSVVNTSSWDAQPSVSSDNRFLYFASSRQGGCGGMDIWCCDMDEMKNGALFFSNLRNLGRRINTRENDFSPFIHADGSTLFFSSEGKYGFGGSDMYISRLQDSLWSEAENLGFPINSRFDDDGLIVSPTSRVAFFSSNRDGAVERSKDLFQLELPREFLPEKVGYLYGKVFDKRTGESVQANIEISQIETGNRKTVTSDITEGFITTLNAGKLYSLHVEREGYLFYSRHLNLKNPSGFNQAERIQIFLEPVEEGKRFILPNVFFDFDSDVLKPESYDELQKLTGFLRDNQHLTIEISGHTDTIGGDAYNLELSTKRSKAIYNYLIRFIDPSRLTFKGYGSLQPISTNDTEEGRAMNRRCEVKILKD